jgi:hypothetical protein
MQFLYAPLRVTIQLKAKGRRLTQVELQARHRNGEKPLLVASLLRGRIKSGQRWSLQNRPTEVAWD